MGLNLTEIENFAYYFFSLKVLLSKILSVLYVFTFKLQGKAETITVAKTSKQRLLQEIEFEFDCKFSFFEYLCCIFNIS